MFTVACSVFWGALSAGKHSPTSAAGISAYNATLTASANTATVGQSITFKVYTWDYKCGQTGYSSNTQSGCGPYGGVAGTEPTMGYSTISASGSGSTLSTTLLETYGANNPGAFTLTSSAAGSKTVTVIDPWGAPLASATVTFSSPVSSSPTPAAASSPGTGSSVSHAATTASAPAQPAAPAAPSVTQVQVEGKTISTAQPATVQVGQPLTLSGKTVANGTVTLYIHSKERTVTVKADKDGIWKYTITQLPVGNHHIEAQVTDPTTKQQSPKTSLLSFAIKPSKNLAAVQPLKNQSNIWGAIAIPGVIALLILVAAFYGYRRYHHRRLAIEETAGSGSGTENTSGES